MKATLAFNELMENFIFRAVIVDASLTQLVASLAQLTQLHRLQLPSNTLGYIKILPEACAVFTENPFNTLYLWLHIPKNVHQIKDKDTGF